MFEIKGLPITFGENAAQNPLEDFDDVVSTLIEPGNIIEIKVDHHGVIIPGNFILTTDSFHVTGTPLSEIAPEIEILLHKMNISMPEHMADQIMIPSLSSNFIRTP